MVVKIPKLFIISLLTQVFGSQASSVVPLKSKDDSRLINDVEAIMSRWTEHFADLFHNPSTIDETVINDLPQREIIDSMMSLPTLAEIKSTIKEVNTGKAPGLDGIPVEILLHGGDKISAEIHALILDVWSGNPVPKDCAMPS